MVASVTVALATLVFALIGGSTQFGITWLIDVTGPSRGAGLVRGGNVIAVHAMLAKHSTRGAPFASSAAR